MSDDGQAPGRSPSRILLVSHEASRTGAPRVAVLIGRVLRDAGAQLTIVSRGPGPLIDEFAGVAPTRVERLFRIRRRLRRYRPTDWAAAALDRALAAWELRRASPDLVYVNSSAAAVYVRAAQRAGIPVILHGHESGPVTEDFVGRAGMRADELRDVLVACSPSVHAELARVTGRAVNDIQLLASVPDQEDVARRADEPAAMAAEPEDVVIGACGSVELRKGADLWCEAARIVLDRLPDHPVRFVWVGSVDQPDLIDPSCSAAGRVSFVGATANPYPYLRRFDVMTLPSRDDPFPLVVLEAMQLGVPVVAFDVGGVSEQVGDGGAVVAAGDVSAFADAIIALVTDTAARQAAGERAHRRAHEEFSTASFGRQLTQIVDRRLSS